MLHLEEWVAEGAAHGASPQQAREAFYAWLHDGSAPVQVASQPHDELLTSLREQGAHLSLMTERLREAQ